MRIAKITLVAIGAIVVLLVVAVVIVASTFDPNEYKGVVDIHDLMIAEPADMLKEIARPASAAVSPFDDSEEVAQKLRDFQLDVLPVIDIHGRLIGAIRHDALLKTLEEAASVDIQMMVGAGREERALSAPQFAVRKRLPWLLINLATAYLAARLAGLC